MRWGSAALLVHLIGSQRDFGGARPTIRAVRPRESHGMQPTCSSVAASPSLQRAASGPAVHHSMCNTGPHSRADGANRTAFVCHEWAWPTRDPSFALFDGETDPAQRLEARAGPKTCMRSASSCHAGGTRSFENDMRYARHASDLVKIKRECEEQCMPYQPCIPTFPLPFGGIYGKQDDTTRLSLTRRN